MTKTAPAIDTSHHGKLCQIFAISRAGSYAVKLAEKRSQEGVQDIKSNNLFEVCTTAFETEQAADLFSGPTAWLCCGNNGGPQTFVSFTALVTAANAMVFHLRG